MRRSQHKKGQRYMRGRTERAKSQGKQETVAFKTKTKRLVLGRTLLSTLQGGKEGKQLGAGKSVAVSIESCYPMASIISVKQESESSANCRRGGREMRKWRLEKG